MQKLNQIKHIFVMFLVHHNVDQINYHVTTTVTVTNIWPTGSSGSFSPVAKVASDAPSPEFSTAFAL